MSIAGSGWTTDQFVGYDVTVIGKADGTFIPVANFRVTANNGDTLTVTPNPAANGVVAGDVVVIRSKPTVGSDGDGNYLLDANWVNSGGSGLTVNAEIGNLIRIIHGLGRGYTYRIKSNTATKVYIDGAWTITPDSTSRYIIEEAVFQDALVAGPFDNSDPNSEVTLTPEVTNYAGQSVVVQVVTLDGVDTPSLPTTSPVRDMYIFGQAPDVRTVTANTTITSDDHTVLCDTTAGSITVTLPDSAAVRGRSFIVKKISADANTVTVDGLGSQTIDGSASVVLSNQWDWIGVVANG